MDRLQLTIGQLMLTGAAVSAAITLIGAVLLLVQHGAEPIHYHLFNPANSHVDNYYSVRGILEVGLYALVFTQVLRVALTAWIFIKERDKWFIVFSIFILGVLVYSLFA